MVFHHFPSCFQTGLVQTSSILVLDHPWFNSRGVAKKNLQHKTFPLGFFSQPVLWLCKSNVGQLRVSHGLMSGNFGSNLGLYEGTWAPTWAHVGLCGAPWNSRGRKKNLQHKTFPLGFFSQPVLWLYKSNVGQLRVSHGLMSGNFGSNLGLYEGTWGPTWAHVGRFGGLCRPP